MAVVVMAVLALPVLSLRLGATDQGNDDATTTTRKAYDLLAEGFGPGFNGPLQVVASGGDTDALVRNIRATDGVARVAALPPAGGVTVIQVVPTTSPQSEKTDQLIDALRDKAIPDAGAQAHVGGVTAISKDFSSVTGDRLPLFIATIIGLGFLLLMVAFRSLVVPLTAAVMNLIAAAASFGVLVAIFQWGWGLDLLGLGKQGPINAFLPVIMLSLLFGLSMDYQVFLVSRMHEEWVHTRDNARAVRVGLAETSRVINSAALIMVCVFLAFVLSGDSGAAMAGVGLAAAVALDAFILRTALVPAAMHLLGNSNWWLLRPGSTSACRTSRWNRRRRRRRWRCPRRVEERRPSTASSATRRANPRRGGRHAALQGRAPAGPGDVTGRRLVHRLGRRPRGRTSWRPRHPRTRPVPVMYSWAANRWCTTWS